MEEQPETSEDGNEGKTQEPQEEEQGQREESDESKDTGRGSMRCRTHDYVGLSPQMGRQLAEKLGLEPEEFRLHNDYDLRGGRRHAFAAVVVFFQLEEKEPLRCKWTDLCIPNGEGKGANGAGGDGVRCRKRDVESILQIRDFSPTWEVEPVGVT